MSDPIPSLAAEPPVPEPIRVLFVDDEPSVLDGLRRSLRRKRNEWEMEFVDSGVAAVEAMCDREFGVLVTDLRMPDVDGFQVLEFAKERQPEALRIVLSGETDFEFALRSVSLAHQSLAKPCERDEVREAIERACTLRGLLGEPQLRQALAAIESLPTTPSLFLELTQLLAREDTGASEIGELLEQDLAMSAKILQVVNSAFFGLPRRVTNMTEAVSFLGQRVIRAMVLGEEAFRPFKGKGSFTPADLEREQEHGLRVARLARAIAGTTDLGESAFLAGMMHDLGWTVAACLLPDRYERFDQQRRAGARGPHVERRTMGATHEALGAFVLGAWGLPLEVVEAVAYHAEPQLLPHEQLSAVTAVHVATALLHELRVADGEPDPRPSGRPLNLAYVESLGLADRVDAWRRLAAEHGQDYAETPETSPQEAT
jgi:HD-like signal output (HDOD) protein/ActR/RegA family two-component response regulator